VVDEEFCNIVQCHPSEYSDRPSISESFLVRKIEENPREEMPWMEALVASHRCPEFAVADGLSS
jgi:hypothetical protein